MAERMAAFSTASRVKLLYGLLVGPATVEQLARRSGLSPNTVSQQLRMLRHLRLVAVTRDGRHAHYTLHDEHRVDLLGAIRHQLDPAEHDWIDPTAATQPHSDAAAR